MSLLSSSGVSAFLVMAFGGDGFCVGSWDVCQVDLSDVSKGIKDATRLFGTSAFKNTDTLRKHFVDILMLKFFISYVYTGSQEMGKTVKILTSLTRQSEILLLLQKCSVCPGVNLTLALTLSSCSTSKAYTDSCKHANPELDPSLILS